MKSRNARGSHYALRIMIMYMCITSQHAAILPASAIQMGENVWVKVIAEANIENGSDATSEDCRTTCTSNIAGGRAGTTSQERSFATPTRDDHEKLDAQLPPNLNTKVNIPGTFLQRGLFATLPAISRFMISAGKDHFVPPGSCGPGRVAQSMHMNFKPAMVRTCF